MYYLIPTDSTEPLGDLLANAPHYESGFNAKREADARKDETGRNWDILEVKAVYSTQTFAEAHLAATDVPNMARD